MEQVIIKIVKDEENDALIVHINGDSIEIFAGLSTLMGNIIHQMRQDGFPDILIAEILTKCQETAFIATEFGQVATNEESIPEENYN